MKRLALPSHCQGGYNDGSEKLYDGSERLYYSSGRLYDGSDGLYDGSGVHTTDQGG